MCGVHEILNKVQQPHIVNCETRKFISICVCFLCLLIFPCRNINYQFICFCICTSNNCSYDAENIATSHFTNQVLCTMKHFPGMMVQSDSSKRAQLYDVTGYR